MKFEELKGKSEDQLKEELLALKKELFNLRFQKVTGELANTSRFKQVKKIIARINTRLTQLQLEKEAA